MSCTHCTSAENTYVVFVRSPEARKRKAPDNTAESSSGPAAKKAKPSKESSSESDSDEEEAVSKAPVTPGKI